jgi:hypothetical protein
LIESDLQFQELKFSGEFLVSPRFSVSADLPIRMISPDVVARANGLGDIRIGFKGAVLEDETRTVTAQFRTYIPSGDAERGLGTDHTSIEPAVLFHQKLDEYISIAGQAGFWIPIGGSSGVPTGGDDKFAGSVFNYGGGVSYNLLQNASARITPVVEFIGWHVLGGFQTLSSGPVKADGVDIANIKIGARIDSGGPSSFYVGYGHALTDSVWYEDIVRLEYRFAF